MSRILSTGGCPGPGWSAQAQAQGGCPGPGPVGGLYPCMHWGRPPPHTHTQLTATGMHSCSLVILARPLKMSFFVILWSSAAQAYFSSSNQHCKPYVFSVFLKVSSNSDIHQWLSHTWIGGVMDCLDVWMILVCVWWHFSVHAFR